MSKLTLSVDARVVTRAKRYARKRGVSVSHLVQEYLHVVGSPPTRSEDPPVLRSLRGLLKSAAVKDYRRFLAAKHR